jgi:hypothetical protein
MMKDHRETRKTGHGGVPASDPQALLAARDAVRRPYVAHAFEAGPVSRTTLRARLALLRLRPLKAEAARSRRS